MINVEIAYIVYKVHYESTCIEVLVLCSECSECASFESVSRRGTLMLTGYENYWFEGELFYSQRVFGNCFFWNKLT